MRDVGAPDRRSRELGYDEGDVDAIVEGALKQQRLLDVAPREPSADDLATSSATPCTTGNDCMACALPTT